METSAIYPAKRFRATPAGFSARQPAFLAGWRFRGVNEMPDLGRLHRKVGHLLLELAVGQREAIVLALMLRPGIHQETLQITVRMFGIVEDAPTSGAVASADALIFVDGVQE